MNIEIYCSRFVSFTEIFVWPNFAIRRTTNNRFSRQIRCAKKKNTCFAHRNTGPPPPPQPHQQRSSRSLGIFRLFHALATHYNKRKKSCRRRRLKPMLAGKLETSTNPRPMNKRQTFADVPLMRFYLFAARYKKR